MNGVWTYPWTLLHEGLEEAFTQLAASGIDEINCAAHYHSVRALQPRFPSQLFEAYSGGVYFEPTDERYQQISPIVNAVEGTDDPFGDIVAAGEAHDIDVSAWTVCYHNSKLGKRYPRFRTEDAFGTAHSHSFCPSNEAVRQYFGLVVEDIAAYSPREIQLESIGFPSVFHGHGTQFGHDKRQVLSSQTEEWLLSQCFCESCLREAKWRGYDIEPAQDLIREFLSASFEVPQGNLPPLAALTREYAVLDELFEFREAIIDEFLGELAERSRSVPLNAYLMNGFGNEPTDGWVAGVTLSTLDDHIDRVTAICYDADPATVADTIKTASRATDRPIDVGLTLDPNCLQSEADVKMMVETVKSQTDGRVFVYHHSLMTDAQLDWMKTAFSGSL